MHFFQFIFRGILGGNVLKEIQKPRKIKMESHREKSIVLYLKTGKILQESLNVR